MRRLYIVLLLVLTLPLAAQDVADIALGETVTVTIGEAAPTALIFINETEGQVVTLSATAVNAEQVDPVIWITNPDSQLLAYNNNHIATDAHITNVVLPTIGQYSIYVDSFNGVMEGDVEVTIATSDVFNMQVETMDGAEIIRFTLPEDTIFSYPLTVTSGEIWTITAYDSSGILDPALRIVDSGGAIIAQNDDHQTTDDRRLNIFDAQITTLAIPTDDNYTIEVLDFVGRSGELTLEIRQIDSENP